MGAILFDLGETLIYLDPEDKRRVENGRFRWFKDISQIGEFASRSMS
jgi:hypothetical protein